MAGVVRSDRFLGSCTLLVMGKTTETHFSQEVMKHVTKQMGGSKSSQKRDIIIKWPLLLRLSYRYTADLEIAWKVA